MSERDDPRAHQPIEKQVEEILKRHCTGSDDHDAENCNKCAAMQEEFELLFSSFFPRKLFKLGDKVILTDEAIRCGVAESKRCGVVIYDQKVGSDRVAVRWDGNKTGRQLHVSFIELVPESRRS